MSNIVKIGEVYSQQIHDLATLHNYIRMYKLVNSDTEKKMLELKPVFEYKFNKKFNDFNVMELEEFRRSFRAEIAKIADKHKLDIN